MDFLMAAPQQSFAGGVTFNLFASSATGSDANNGQTALTPKATLAAINALSPALTSNIALFAGSTWFDVLFPPNGVQVVASFGAGANPIIDGAKTIPNASFSLVSGNIYQASITCSTVSSAGTGSQGTYVLWENGNWLTRAASQAAMVAGTYFVAGGPSNMSTVTPNATLFVWPADSSSPITNGRLYEFPSQFAAIDNFNHDNATYTGTVGRRAGGYFGSTQGGLNTTLNRCLSAMCGRHNFVVGSGTMNDCIAFDCDDRTVYSDPSALIVFFTNVGTGKSFTVNRSMAIMPAGRQQFSSRVGSLLCHGSSATFDNATVNGFITVGAGPINLSATNSITANDIFSVGNAAIGNGVTCPYVINRPLVNSIGQEGGLSLTAAGSTPGLPASILDGALYNGGIGIDASLLYTVKYNTVVINITNGDCISGNSSPSTGSIFSNNIFVLGATAVNNGFVRMTGPWATFDYNVYVNASAGNTFAWINNGSASFSLAAWQAATGYDTHSVFLNAAQAAQLFLNGPSALANGDFRINPACNLTFTDGTPIVGNAGPRQYYDWNQAKVVNGQPFKWWVPPATEAQCKTYIANPPAWPF